jgi:hypothetical protein
MAYKNSFADNLTESAALLAEITSRIVEGIDVTSLKETLSIFGKFLENIPDDAKNTIFFGKVMELKKLNLKYEDVVWLIDDFGTSYTESKWKKIAENEDAKFALQRYIGEIVSSSSLNKREKLIILLAHMEPLIYETTKISKGSNDHLKEEVERVSIKNNQGMSAESLGKIYVLAVMYIVFANTSKYTDAIDKRMPFRNNILHNGIVTYSDEDIDVAYDLMINLIEILLVIKEQLNEE